MYHAKVLEFERLIADFYGATYGVATDSCTHALELCLRLEEPKHVTLTYNTYVSVPFTLEKLDIDWRFTHDEWTGFYWSYPTRIVDAAGLWEANSYIPNSLMCLSFQHKKTLSTNRGGMILLDSKEDYTALKKMSHDGRIDGITWEDQDIDTVGYHYYMTPEAAELGIAKFDSVKNSIPKKRMWNTYPDLREMSVFKRREIC